jgi:hypothetical protein
MYTACTVERVTICFFTPCTDTPRTIGIATGPLAGSCVPWKSSGPSGSVCENVPYALSSIYVVPSYAHAPWPMTDAPCAMAARQRQPPQPPRAAAGHAHTDTCGARSILGRLEYLVDVLVDVVSTLCRVRDQSHRDKTKHSHNTHTRDSETRTKHSVKI